MPRIYEKSSNPLVYMHRKFNGKPKYRVDESGCWIWTGSTSMCNGGVRYGTTTWKQKPIHAHRASWLFLRGPIPDGYHIDHLCRVTLCVNPDHLEPVPVTTNIHRGMACKLSMEIARYIRQQVAQGASQLALAKQFGVSDVNINRTVNGHQWKEI